MSEGVPNLRKIIEDIPGKTEILIELDLADMELRETLEFADAARAAIDDVDERAEVIGDFLARKYELRKYDINVDFPPET
jgi:hypothetical protein